MEKYKVVRDKITPGDLATVICEINNSKDFELGEYSHIVLKGTNTRVGYIGDDALELVNPNKKEFVKYHNNLKKIFSYDLNNHY